MSTEYPGAEETLGRAQRPAWLRGPAIVAAVAVVALAGGAGAAYAASGGASSPAALTASSPATSPSASPGGPGHRDIRGFGGLGLVPGSRMAGAVHGQLVVPKSGGGYRTVDVQSGQVTAVSGTSITVKSADGFSQQYAVTSATIVDAKRDTIGSVKTGDQVFVLATVTGSTATAVRVMDRDLIGQGHPGAGFGGWGDHDRPRAPGLSGTGGAQVPPI